MPRSDELVRLTATEAVTLLRVEPLHFALGHEILLLEMPIPTRENRRRGITIVEATLVLSVFLMMLFGMFEYCRFLMVLHITNNAARDGARYAVVNLDKPDNFNTTNYGTRPSVVNYTTTRMGGVQRQINNVHATYSPTGYQVEVPAPVCLRMMAWK